MMSEILITGATGFVGSGVLKCLLSSDTYRRVTVLVRQDNKNWPARVSPRVIGNLESVVDWLDVLEGISIIVHCAARVHVMKDSALNPLEQYRLVNVVGTLNLARQAASSGVRRFIFISSIGVNGAETVDRPFNAQDLPMPHSDYALSKYEAELGLQKIASETRMEVVIIRPPLVYGAFAPGNFGTLLSWVSCGIPLPLGGIQNQRSFVALENLVDLIMVCIRHPAAANQIFLISDGEDISTAELIRRIGVAIGKPVFLIPIPTSWIQFMADTLGKGDAAKSLCASLQVDIRKTCQVLGWAPPATLDQGLKKLVKRI